MHADDDAWWLRGALRISLSSLQTSWSDWLWVYAAQGEAVDLGDPSLRQLVLGVGKTRAALALQAHLLEERGVAGQHAVRGVVLYGVAGAYPQRHRSAAPPVGLGEVCVVASDVFGDEGVETPEGFLDLPALGLHAVGELPASPEVAALVATRLGVPTVRGATVSTCSGTERLSRAIHGRTGADVETMEGAAVALVCRRMCLPMLHLRSISNWTGDRDRSGWDLGTAVSAMGRALRRLVGGVAPQLRA